MSDIEKVGEKVVAPEFADGAHFLKFLGFEDLIGKPIPNRDLPWEGFLGLCGPETITFLEKLEHTDPTSHEYEVMMQYTRGFVKEHIEGHNKPTDQA